MFELRALPKSGLWASAAITVADLWFMAEITARRPLLHEWEFWCLLAAAQLVALPMGWMILLSHSTEKAAEALHLSAQDIHGMMDRANAMIEDNRKERRETLYLLLLLQKQLKGSQG